MILTSIANYIFVLDQLRVHLFDNYVLYQRNLVVSYAFQSCQFFFAYAVLMRQ